VISKLENADFENLTSFFDSKKHGNWAGPDQWYHRRYQLTLQSHKNKQRRGERDGSTDESDPAQRNASADGSVSVAAAPRPRRERQRKWIDFMAVAGGELIEEKEFDEPQRSYNTLTQGVLDKNRKQYHTLPKDLQIKPDLFIKLFHRPNYSVWKHWLNQHKLRMMKRRNQSEDGNVNGDGMGINEQGNISMNGSFMNQQAMMDNGGAPIDLDAMDRSQIMAMEQMAQFDNGGDDDGQFQYDYQNPLDTSHFVPDMGGGGGSYDFADDGFDFNLNGYDLIEADPDKQVERIHVEYAVTAKKVNVRKLKLKLWDRIDADIVPKDKENVTPPVEDQAEDADIEMDDVAPKKVDKAVTFQDSLASLPANISSAISVQMCFICLLHLANEKELQFVPKEGKTKMDGKVMERGDFEIQYANANSEFEKEAAKTNQVMIL